MTSTITTRKFISGNENTNKKYFISKFLMKITIDKKNKKN